MKEIIPNIWAKFSEIPVARVMTASECLFAYPTTVPAARVASYELQFDKNTLKGSSRSTSVVISVIIITLEMSIRCLDTVSVTATHL